MVEFSHACSIGNYCFSSALLNVLGIRDRALPFDWLFTTPKFTVEILDNDFSYFLNKDYIVDIADVSPQNGNQAGHSLYHKNFFNHKDPRNEEDYEYYVRCIDRFRDFIKLGDKKLFICSYKNLEKVMDDNLMWDIFELNKSLRSLTKNYHLLCHINYPNSKERKTEITEIGNVTFFELYTKLDNHGLGYGDGEDSKLFYKTFHELFKYKK